MAVSFIGSASAAATSVTLPAHQTGDLIVIFAVNGSSSVPTLPAGFTGYASVSGPSTQRLRIGYKVAASSSETSGTWTNAIGLVAHVYRGAFMGVGASASPSSVTTISYPALTLTDTDNTAWVANFGYVTNTSSTLENAPSGFTARQGILVASGEIASFDTNSTVSSYAGGTVALGASSSGIAYSLEIRPTRSPISGDGAATEDGDTLSAQAGSPPLIYIGSATGTNTGTLPEHQAGDLILVFAFRDGSTTSPTLGASFTSVRSSAGNTCAGVLGYKLAASSAETFDTWTNATSVIAMVYRGADQTSPLGTSNGANGLGTSVDYPGLTLTAADGTSWIAGFSGHRSTDTALETPPPGMVLRANTTDATDEASAFDTQGWVSSWTTQTVSVGGTSSGWSAITVEIIPAKPPRVGSLAVTEAGDTLAANSFATAGGSLAATEADDVLSASGGIKGVGFVGAASTATAASVVLPSHQAGDLILIFAFRKGSATSPSLPAGFTNIRNQQEFGGGSSFRLGYKIAASGSETSGTWTNATSLVAQVYRNVSDSPIGDTTYADGSTASVLYPGVTLHLTDGQSWVATFAGITTNTSTIEAAPTGETLRTNSSDATNGEVAGFDTNGSVSSWGNQTIGVGSAASWLATAVEIIPRLKGSLATVEAGDSVSAAALGPNGSASITEAGDTLTATGATAIVGTLVGTEAGDTIASAGGLAIQAAGAITEGADTASGTGTVAIRSASTITEGDDTSSSAGALAIKGSAAIAEADDTIAADGDIAGGVLAATEDDDALSSTAALAITGAFSATEGGDIVSGAGALQVSGAANITEADDTISATGAISARGSVDATEAGDTVSASAGLPIKASASVTEAGDTVAAAGTLPVGATLAATEAGDSVSATGTLPLHGAVSTTEADDTVAGFAGATVTGQVSATEAGDTVSATGKLSIVGSASQTEASDTLASAGANTSLGSLAATEANDTLSGSAHISIAGLLAATEADDTSSTVAFTGGMKFRYFNGTRYITGLGKIYTEAGWQIITISGAP